MGEHFETWAVVDLFGHIRHAGRVTEEDRFGTRLGRVDVPTPTPCTACDGTRKCAACGGFPLAVSPATPCADCDGRGDCPACGGDGTVEGLATVYFGGSSVFRMTPCTEEAARAVAAQSRPAPVHRLALPARGPGHGRDDELDDPDFGDDEG